MLNLITQVAIHLIGARIPAVRPTVALDILVVPHLIHQRHLLAATHPVAILQARHPLADTLVDIPVQVHTQEALAAMLPQALHTLAPLAGILALPLPGILALPPGILALQATLVHHLRLTVDILVLPALDIALRQELAAIVVQPPVTWAVPVVVDCLLLAILQSHHQALMYHQLVHQLLRQHQ